MLPPSLPMVTAANVRRAAKSGGGRTRSRDGSRRRTGAPVEEEEELTKRCVSIYGDERSVELWRGEREAEDRRERFVVVHDDDASLSMHPLSWRFCILHSVFS